MSGSRDENLETLIVWDGSFYGLGTTWREDGGFPAR